MCFIYSVSCLDANHLQPQNLINHTSADPSPSERQSCQPAHCTVLMQLCGFQDWPWVRARQLGVQAGQAQVCPHTSAKARPKKAALGRQLCLEKEEEEKPHTLVQIT